MRRVLASLTDVGCREQIERVLDDVSFGAHAASELEFLQFLRSHGLPEPDRLQVLVRTGTGKRYLDGRYDRLRVSVEVDGAHHMEVAQWDADALRSLELAVVRRGSGETVIRLTMGNLRYDGQKVAGHLRQLLE
jgi:very-short-patch-repair endonuclease